MSAYIQHLGEEGSIPQWLSCWEGVGWIPVRILLFPRHAILAPTFRHGTFHRTSKVWTPMNNQGELIQSLKPWLAHVHKCCYIFITFQHISAYFSSWLVPLRASSGWYSGITLHLPRAGSWSLCPGPEAWNGLKNLGCRILMEPENFLGSIFSYL